jgi:hypothetical protein
MALWQIVLDATASTVFRRAVAQKRNPGCFFSKKILDPVFFLAFWEVLVKLSLFR